MNAEENPENLTSEAFVDQAGNAGDDPLTLVTRERDELKDQILRVQAEFQNAMRRERQMIDVRRAEAIGAVSRDVLEVMDNFDRALESARSGGPATASILSGLEMVQKQLLAALAKHNVVPIEAQGQPFNPDEHEAVMQRPSADHPEGTVIQVLAQGYKLGDRVLRPAKVIVSVAG
ncbi:nucleotide exchange factor GrpE [bacterium]|nr:nucleotide exchange factor GrpE [bacterium]